MKFWVVHFYVFAYFIVDGIRLIRILISLIGGSFVYFGDGLGLSGSLC
jgi:hypothetical protein